MDLICEAAKYLATLYHLLIILPAVEKLFGVKDSQGLFFNLLVCLRHQAYKMNLQTCKCVSQETCQWRWLCEQGCR